MAVPVRKLTIDLAQIVGDALPVAMVRVTLTRPDVTLDGQVVIASSIEIPCDVDGHGEAFIFPNALGTQQTQYDCEIFSQGARVFPETGHALFYMPDADSALHAVLFSVPPYVFASQADVDFVLQQAQDWATKFTTTTSDTPPVVALPVPLYSAKYNAALASDWADWIGSDVPTMPVGSRSARSWAQDDLRGVVYLGSSRDWAQGGGLIDGTTYKSSRGYALDAKGSADAVAGSAAAAAGSAAAADGSAGNAKASADVAGVSAAAANTSAQNASGSAAGASASATVATTKANAAAGSATAAGGSASAAQASAVVASGSAAAANTSATTASDKANVATTKATAASASADAAAGSASAAAGSVTVAAMHAGNASTSASQAEGAASDAGAAAAGADTSAGAAARSAGAAATSEANALGHASDASLSANAAAGSAAAASSSAGAADVSAQEASDSAAAAADVQAHLYEYAKIAGQDFTGQISAPRMQAVGPLSAAWGVNGGANTGGVNVLQGVGAGATWLLSGTSAGIFRAGLQSLDASPTVRLYAGPASYLELNGTGNVTATSFTGALLGTATNATNVGIADDLGSATAQYPVFVSANAGNLPAKVSSSKLTYTPATGTVSAPVFAGSLTGTADAAKTAQVFDNADNALRYPVFATGGVGAALQLWNNAKMSFNPSTGVLGVSGIATTGGATVGGQLTVAGDLVVNGTTFTVNSQTVTVDDPVMTLGGDTAPTQADAKDRGIEFRWHDGIAAKDGFFGFNHTTRRFTFIPDAVNTGDAFSGAKGTIDANVVGDVTGNLTGNVNGNVIGNLTGAVTGPVNGDVIGNLTGDVTGNVHGSLTGPVTGDVTGNLHGNVTGNVTGNLTGNVTGTADKASTITVTADDATNVAYPVLFGSVAAGVATAKNGTKLTLNPSTGALSIGGAVSAASMTVTGDMHGATASTTGNATVGGALTVGGAAGVASLTAVGDVHSATTSTTGNAAVGGTLTVTGGSTAGSYTTTGDVHAVNAVLTGDMKSVTVHVGAGNAGFSAAVADTLSVFTAGVNRWTVTPTGHFTPAADVTYDIGSTAATVRTLYANALQAKANGALMSGAANIVTWAVDQLTMLGGMKAWATATPGTGKGSLHIGDGGSVTANAGPAITFGARDSGAGATAQAGIYSASDVAFGTRLYLATTDNYTTGPKMAMQIGEAGNVTLLRAALRVNNPAITNDPTNFERGSVAWNANVLELGIDVGGTGVARDMRLRTGVGKSIFLGHTGVADRWRMDASGNIAPMASNSYDLGQPTLAVRTAYLNLVKFPSPQVASADPNTLDDYVEGTWTPQLLINGVASPGMVYVSQQGFYTKVGRLVTILGYVGISAKGSGVGTVGITGIPMTGIAPQPLSLWVNSLTGLTSPVSGLVSAGATFINLYQQNAGGVSAISDANLTANAAISFSLVLMTP